MKLKDFFKKILYIGLYVTIVSINNKLISTLSKTYLYARDTWNFAKLCIKEGNHSVLVEAKIPGHCPSFSIEHANTGQVDNTKE